MNQILLGLILFVGAASSASAFTTSEASMTVKPTAYRCYARAHNFVFVKPAIWGDDSPTAEEAATSAEENCIRQMGWNAGCRVEACYPVNR